MMCKGLTCPRSRWYSLRRRTPRKPQPTMRSVRQNALPALPLYCAVDGWVVSRRVGGVRGDTPGFRWYQRAYPETLYKVES